MEFFKICQGGCGRRVIIRRIREFKSRGIPLGIKSQSKMCGRCYRAIKRMIPQ